jgi:hypothetical protein
MNKVGVLVAMATAAALAGSSNFATAADKASSTFLVKAKQVGGLER